MLVIFLLAAFFVVSASFLIALATATQDLKGGVLEEYLFGFNRPHLAALSNVGSILSVSIVFVAVIPAVAGWGYVSIYGLVAGVLIGYMVFGVSVRRINEQAVSKHGNLPRRLSDILPSQAAMLVSDAQIVMLFLFIMVEFSVVRIYLANILDVPGAVTGMAVLLIAMMCAVYTALGGFVGVLRTDLFQSVVMSVSVLLAVGVSSDDLAIVLRQSWRTGLLAVSDWTFLVATSLVVCAFFCGMPDLWIRTVGTLSRRNRRPDLRPLVWGAIGIVTLVIPVALLGLAVAGHGRELERTMSVDNTLVFLQHSLGALVSHPIGGIVLWWLAGAFACLVVTTIDTWLVTCMQQMESGSRVLGRRYLRVIAVPFVLLAAISSFFAAEWVIWSAGALGFVVPFGNAAILLLAAFRPERLGGVLSRVKIYYGVAAITTVVFLVLWGREISGKIHQICLFLAVEACILIFFLSRDVAAER